MTSFSLNTVETRLSYQAQPSPLQFRDRPPNNRWSHGRSYVVIALIAPLLLASLLLIYLHNATKTRLSLWRL